MNIQKEEDRHTVELSEECTIIDVGPDLETLAAAVAEAGEIVVKADAVAEIDTAYFQMLLSLKKSAAERKISFTIVEPSESLRRFGRLYGIEL